jgi:hypothetical protein
MLASPGTSRTNSASPSGAESVAGGGGGGSSPGHVVGRSIADEQGVSPGKWAATNPPTPRRAGCDGETRSRTSNVSREWLVTSRLGVRARPPWIASIPLPGWGGRDITIAPESKGLTLGVILDPGDWAASSTPQLQTWGHHHGLHIPHRGRAGLHPLHTGARRRRGGPAGQEVRRGGSRLGRGPGKPGYRAPGGRGPGRLPVHAPGGPRPSSSRPPSPRRPQQNRPFR